jgi:hypothetical protein
MYIKRLTENLVQKALLLFEILSFEVYCRSDRLPATIWGVGDSPYQRYAESATLRINDTRSRRLPVSLSRGVVFQILISPRIAVVATTQKKFKRCRLLRLKILNAVA